MPKYLRALLPVLMLTLALATAACESSHDKAERYYQQGLALLKAGDVDRALVEFRNVFKYDGFHKDARLTYARLVFERGQIEEAYGQYLRVIEQYPDTVEARQALAEMAITRGDWTEAERHGRAAFALDPKDPRSIALNLALDYRKALLAKDTAGAAKQVANARSLLQTAPDNLVARRIVIDSAIMADTPQAATADVEAGLKTDPKSLEFNMLKLRLLVQTKDSPAVGAQLQAMFALYPDNPQIQQGLVAWYLGTGDTAGAEAFMRKLADAAPDDAAPHVAVVQLLQRTKGADAARAELDSLTKANAGKPQADLYRSLMGSMDFDAGKPTEAIATLEDVLRTAQPSDQTRSIKAVLAKMMEATGNLVGARARVEEILAEDPTNVEALKMRANWLIAADKPGEAIVDLRTAMDQNPRDSAILTLMATAQERDGNLELAGEQLAQAVDVSGKAPAESLRYAGYLAKTKRGAAAEGVLNDALGVTPASVPLLSALAQMRVIDKDWPKVQESLTTLRAIQTPEAQKAADGVQAALLLGQSKSDDSIAFLQSLVDNGSANISAVAVIVQTQIREGKTAEARTYIDAALAKAPQDPNLRLLSANLYATAGDAAKAEEIYRSLISEAPTAEAPVHALYALLVAEKHQSDADAVLTAGLVAKPKSGTLRWIKAGRLEQTGDIDGAITIYEALYAEDSSNMVVANNLASLITARRDDPASLDRAYAIARRLNGSDQPAYQDTYGWIAYRRASYAEALTALEPAARGLPDDALVQFHLGMAYAALGDFDKATPVLTAALRLAGDSALPQFQTARDTLAAIKAGTAKPLALPDPTGTPTATPTAPAATPDPAPANP